jgi:hypothetical protein
MLKMKLYMYIDCCVILTLIWVKSIAMLWVILQNKNSRKYGWESDMKIGTLKSKPTPNGTQIFEREKQMVHKSLRKNKSSSVMSQNLSGVP